MAWKAKRLLEHNNWAALSVLFAQNVLKGFYWWVAEESWSMEIATRSINFTGGSQRSVCSLFYGR